MTANDSDALCRTSYFCPSLSCAILLTIHVIHLVMEYSIIIFLCSGLLYLYEMSLSIRIMIHDRENVRTSLRVCYEGMHSLKKNILFFMLCLYCKSVAEGKMEA